MLKKVLATAVLAAAVGLIGVPYASADHGDLSGEAARDVMSGATVTGTTRRGNNFETKVSTDGSLRVNVVESGFSDDGKWTIEGDKYCSQWNTIRNGNKRCSTIRHLNGEKFLIKSDNDRTAVKITK